MAPSAGPLGEGAADHRRQDDPGRERVEGQRGAQRGRGAAAADDGDVGDHRRDGERAGQVGPGAGEACRCAAAAEPLARSMPSGRRAGAQPRRAGDVGRARLAVAGLARCRRRPPDG